MASQGNNAGNKRRTIGFSINYGSLKPRTVNLTTPPASIPAGQPTQQPAKENRAKKGKPGK